MEIFRKKGGEGVNATFRNSNIQCSFSLLCRKLFRKITDFLCFVQFAEVDAFCGQDSTRQHHDIIRVGKKYWKLYKDWNVSLIISIFLSWMNSLNGVYWILTILQYYCSKNISIEGKKFYRIYKIAAGLGIACFIILTKKVLILATFWNSSIVIYLQ